MFTAIDLIEAQFEIAWRTGYPRSGDRKKGYTALLFSNDLNTLHYGIVKITNGKPNQMYHARRGAMCVPPIWEPVVRELVRLARMGFTYPPTPWTRPRRG